MTALAQRVDEPDLLDPWDFVGLIEQQKQGERLVFESVDDFVAYAQAISADA